MQASARDTARTMDSIGKEDSAAGFINSVH